MVRVGVAERRVLELKEEVSALKKNGANEKTTAEKERELKRAEDQFQQDMQLASKGTALLAQSWRSHRSPVWQNASINRHDFCGRSGCDAPHF